MKRSTKIIIFALSSLALGLVILSVLAQIYLAPMAKRLIEEKGSVAIGSPLTVGSLSISLFPPVTAHAEDIRFHMKNPDVDAILPKVSFHSLIGLSLDPIHAIKSLSIELENPKIVVIQKSDSTTDAIQNKAAQEKGTASLTPSATGLPDIPFSFKIKNGNITIHQIGQDVEMNPVELSFDAESLQSMMKAEFKSELALKKSEHAALKIPVEVKSEFTYDGTTFTSKKTTGAVMGLDFTADGAQNLKSKTGEWKLKADTKNFEASYSKEGKELKGPLDASFDIHVFLEPEGYRFARLNANANLDRAELKISNTFLKPAGTPMHFNIEADGDKERLNFKNFKFSLANLNGDAQGSIAYGEVKGASSNLNFAIARTSLTGWEKFLPALGQEPVSGFVEVKGSLRGDLQNPQAVTLQISPFRLEDFRGKINYVSEDKKTSMAGSFIANLGMNLGGTYNLKQGIEKSPLTLKGSVSVQIPKLVYKSSPENSSNKDADKSADPKKPKEKPEALLPNWPVARTAQIETQFNLSEFTYNDLAIKGIKWTGSVNQGALKGEALINQIFSGTVTAANVEMSLTQPQPDTKTNLKLTHIDANQALTWLSPTWKDLIKGNLSASANVMAAHPSRSDFIERTQAQGSAHLENAFVSGLQLDQLLNQQIAKIPGLGGKELVKTKGFAADIKTSYDFHHSTLNLTNFVFSTPDKNELQAQGSVDVNKNANLSGTAYLATAPVGGSVRSANSDANGRFVIPFQIKGNLANPQVSFAQNTVEQMLKNTAKKELQNLGKKNLNEQLEQLKKKGLKGLFGH